MYVSSGTRRFVACLVAIVVTLALAGCKGDAEGGTNGTDPPNTVEPTDTVPPDGGDATGVMVYFVRDGKIAASVHHVSGDQSRRSPQELAVAETLAGPTSSEKGYGFTTTIPDGTRLLGLSTDEHGVTTVDLSGAFDDGGGTLSTSLRLAQVVCALTQFPDCTGVLFKTDGKPVEVFSGEGIILDGPKSRADYEELLPAILVESPLTGAVIPAENSGTVVMYGSANVFEAVFRVEIRAGDGTVLAEQRVEATSGTGTRGTFQVDVEVYVPARYDDSAGSVVFFEPSAKDGSPINVVTIPVVLRASGS